MTLTYPERVNANNITYLQKLVAAGAHKHPGANYFNRLGFSRKDLGYGDTKVVAQKLRVNLFFSSKFFFNRVFVVAG